MPVNTSPFNVYVSRGLCKDDYEVADPTRVARNNHLCEAKAEGPRQWVDDNKAMFSMISQATDAQGPRYLCGACYAELPPTSSIFSEHPARVRAIP